jgi:glutamate-1-semialdehyde 2,1-aminomutase
MPSFPMGAALNSKDAHWLKDSLRGAGEILRVTAIAGIVAIAELRWPDDRSRTEKLADYILASTRALGPLYVKMAQILAAQSGVISEGFRRRLQTTFDRNPAIPHARIEKAIEQSYGEPLGARFATFDACPIGVGTIAQVHRATLVTGENVAVKVVKPGAGRSLRTALIAVSLLIGLADVFMPRARPLRLRQNFRDLRKVVEAQTDMRLELQNQLAVARSFDGHPFVRVPRTFASHCNVSVLVMEFVEGVKGYEVDRIEIDRTLLARRLQDTFYTMIYLHGRFHVDPHPGNLLLNSDGKLVLLDFGLFGTLSEELKWDLSGFYYACVHKNWESATTRFVRCFVDEDVSRLKNDEEFKVKLCSILRVHFEERTNRWSTVGFIRDTHSLLYARSLRMKSGMPLLILCLLTGEGLLHDVDSRVDIWANARHFVDRASPYVSESVRLRFDRAIGRTLPKSIEARRAARDVLVAPTHLDRFVLPSEYPLVVKKAQGAWLEDIDGHRYVDLSGGYGPHLLGHGHHVIVDALVETLRSKWVNALATEEEILLAQTIAAAFPGNNRVIFSNSGTEAILIAIRLCRAFTGRQKVAKFEGHFHGHSDQGLVSAWFRFAGTEQCPEPIAGTLGTASSIVASTMVLQYGHSDGLDVIYKQRKELACVICEPMPYCVTTTSNSCPD